MSHEITATILSIGDELLIGQTINTNAGWMGEQLSLIGIRPTKVLVIGDDKQTILDALGNLDTDVMLITGGLGPTKDDITKHTLCEFFGTKLVRHPHIEAHIAAFFANLGREPLEVNRAQADLPEGCTVVPNDRGTASGMWFEKDGKIYVSMPGVPYEMKAMMEKHVLPELQRFFTPPAIFHRTVLTTGLGESHLAQRIAAWEDSLEADHIKLAYLPSPGLVRLRLSTYASNDPAGARRRVDQKVGQLYRLVPELIFGEGDDRLEAVVGRLLKERGESLSLAESCTGGYVSHLVSSIPGSSAYYVGTVVSYANAVKMRELGIPADMLELEGAVSKPVVEKMAEGIREALGTHWGIAISGVAGPDGGTEEKPVGTVWMAVAGPDGVQSVKGNFPGSRDLVVQRSALAALNMLRKALLNGKVPKPLENENL